MLEHMRPFAKPLNGIAVAKHHAGFTDQAVLKRKLLHHQTVELMVPFDGTGIPLGIDDVVMTVLMEESRVKARCVYKDRLRPRAARVTRRDHIIGNVLEGTANLTCDGVGEPKTIACLVIRQVRRPNACGIGNAAQV